MGDSISHPPSKQTALSSGICAILFSLLVWASLAAVIRSERERREVCAGKGRAPAAVLVKRGSEGEERNEDEMGRSASARSTTAVALLFCCR
eukprot:2820216-Rhodomonas_salina.1